MALDAQLQILVDNWFKWDQVSSFLIKKIFFFNLIDLYLITNL